MTSSNFLSLIWPCIFLMLVVTTVQFDIDGINRCDNTKGCPGPVAHYNSLNCEPIYSFFACCPWRYNCDHLYEKERYYCHVNNSKYPIGRNIRKEDANLCEENCTCTYDYWDNQIAYFECFREKLCPRSVPSNNSCYLRNSVRQCCPEEVCTQTNIEESGNVRPSCVDRDGRSYLDGEYVVPKYQSHLMCVCRVNKNGTWFFECNTSNRWFWSDIQATTAFLKNCPPLYLPLKDNIVQYQTIAYMCRMYTNSWGLKSIITTRRTRNGYQCVFDGWIFNLGDQILKVGFGSYSCIVCTCEVSPVPTCVLMDRLFC